VTGTDTNVGKSVVSAALTAWMRREKLNVVAMKPVETGGSTADAELLYEASGRSLAMDETCPYRFPDPLAPMIAARKAGAVIETADLDSKLAAISKGRDGVIIEGAGGIMVPLSADLSYAALFRKWNVDLIIVAANRLGIINHALLTVGAARTAGIPILALVLNDVPVVDPADVSRESNRDAIAELIGKVPIISFPTLAHPRDISELADAADSSGLGYLARGQSRR
jgi:dethiobiotin synthetase